MEQSMHKNDHREDWALNVSQAIAQRATPEDKSSWAEVTEAGTPGSGGGPWVGMSALNTEGMAPQESWSSSGIYPRFSQIDPILGV